MLFDDSLKNFILEGSPSFSLWSTIRGAGLGQGAKKGFSQLAKHGTSQYFLKALCSLGVRSILSG